jgi:hypothetical protein
VWRSSLARGYGHCSCIREWEGNWWFIDSEDPSPQLLTEETNNPQSSPPTLNWGMVYGNVLTLAPGRLPDTALALALREADGTMPITANPPNPPAPTHHPRARITLAPARQPHAPLRPLEPARPLAVQATKTKQKAPPKGAARGMQPITRFFTKQPPQQEPVAPAPEIPTHTTTSAPTETPRAVSNRGNGHPSTLRRATPTQNSPTTCRRTQQAINLTLHRTRRNQGCRRRCTDADCNLPAGRDLYSRDQPHK